MLGSLFRYLWRPKPTMGLEKFMTHLAGTGGAWGYEMTSQDGAPDPPLRTENGDCPITAVCRHLTGLTYDVSAVDTASMKIGLPPILANLIVEAADGEKSHSPRLRRKLLIATGMLPALAIPPELERTLTALEEGPAEATATCEDTEECWPPMRRNDQEPPPVDTKEEDQEMDLALAKH